ncbi:MAG: aminomethyltransferase family protein [Coriobacteriales bacterium]|nr:aminomethyltransferase family protein [Coriobacteriales bacterium]
MLFKEDAVARAEANAVRNNAAWYRWTHDLVQVSGPDAEAFLDLMLVNTIAGLPVGRGKYTTMLDEDGGIIDDLVVLRRTADVWWLSTLYGPHAVRWFDAHKAAFDVDYRDITQQVDMYAVQGPNSAKVMNALLPAPVDGLKRFQIIETSIGGIAVSVDRGGFTGELGFEVYCAREDSAAVAQAIEQAAATFDAPRLKTLEVYVRSLPMEKGMALRQDYKGLTPFEANLGWSVHMDKDFIGKAALERALAEGPKRAFVGVEIERESYEDIAQNEIVRKRGVPVGICRQMIYGYTVDKNIGFAIVDAKKVPLGTRVTIGPNDSPAIIVEPKWC